jgi:dTDP-4-dehydrorhamnose 3,5-epimerase
MSSITVEDTHINGVQVLTRTQRADERGFLERLFDDTQLQPVLASRRVEQVNRTKTLKAGTVRGLHLQLSPASELKIVSCLRGSVFDVAVDLRPGSPTFGTWFGCELTSDNGRALVIPEGCAHGVQALEDDCDLLYVHTAPYTAEAERGLNPLDANVGIVWPMAPTGLSARDISLPSLGRWKRGGS